MKGIIHVAFLNIMRKILGYRYFVIVQHRDLIPVEPADAIHVYNIGPMRLDKPFLAQKQLFHFS